MLLPQGDDQLLHLQTGEGVQRPQRLVQQQQARAMDQRAGQRNALLLPARQRRRPLLRAALESDAGQCLQGGVAPGAFNPSPTLSITVFHGSRRAS
jgi:hypothetical protein